MDEKGKIAKAAGKISVATFISRILGYIKDMILAFYFGATGLSDTFFAAFRIPNLLRELFAEGAMSAAFIPVLTEQRQKHGEEEAKRLVKITFTFILLAAGIVSVAGIFVAPGIVTVIVPGFLAKSPEQFSLTVLLTRIMFPFLLFISLAALVMGALNTKKVFFVPALAPAMLNVTIIVTVTFFAQVFERPIIAVALGVTIGGFMQFAFQLPTFFKNNYRLGIDLGFRHPGLRRMAVLLIPATLALAVNQVYIVMSTMLASFLPEGSITYLYYSMRLIQFPIGIFGVAMGMAVLPTLSRHAVKRDFVSLREDFSFSLRLLFFITVPAMAGLIALREPIVNLLFQRGTFDYAATKATADALLYYSMGIWSTVGIKIVTVTFYSMQDTKTPVKIAAVGVVFNLLLSLALMGPLKHSGIALAYSVAAGLNFTLLFYFLKRKLQRIDSRKIIKSFIKVLLASVLMGITGGAVLSGDMWTRSGNNAEKALYLAGTMAGCAAIYFLAGFLLKNEEMKYMFEMYKQRIRKKGAA